jgi:hypothetical protein
LSDTDAQCTTLEQNNEKLRRALEDEKNASTWLLKQMGDLQLALSATKVDLGKGSRKNSMLQKDIRALNERAELLRPLVDIGVATRLRFLQQARRTVHKHPLSEADKVFIKNGNVAAHGGNGLADAALFKGYLVAKNNIVAQVFKDLYHCEPSDYLDQNEITILRRMLDCEATIMTVQKANKSNESAALRKEHFKLLDKLYAAQKKSSSITAWEQNQQNTEWLERLEEITAEIVRLDMKKGSSGKKGAAVSHLLPPIG